MHLLEQAIHRFTQWALTPLDWIAPVWSLTLVSVLTGVFALWCVKRFTAQRKLARARDRMLASVYEIRLFAASPHLVLRAQARLVAASLRYLVLASPALVVMALPLSLLFVHFEARHHAVPCRVGEPFVVHVSRAETSTDGATHPWTATCVSGCRVTAEPLVTDKGADLYVRVEADEPGVAVLAIEDPTTTAHVSLVVGTGHDLWNSPMAPAVNSVRIGLHVVDWSASIEQSVGPTRIDVDIPYEYRPENWFALGWPWWTWWLFASTVTALVLRRPMGVVL